MSVERLTAMKPENIGDGTLFYNSALLPIDMDRAKGVILPNPISGSYDSLANPAFRPWKAVYYGSTDPRNSWAPRLAEYEGRPVGYTPGSGVDPDTQTQSFGDGNNIDEWTYEVVDISFLQEIELVNPNLMIEKGVDKETANVGDILTYTIKVTNLEGYEVYDLIVTDSLQDMSGAKYTLNSIKVDGIVMTDIEDADEAHIIDNIIEVVLPTLAPEQIIEITFEVVVQASAQGKTLVNIAVLENPLDPENPIESETVEIKVPNVVVPSYIVPNTGVK